ncbi:alpha/beta hydrolase [Lewinella sp. W8]|uniref:alpha/beta hydrolase n=1 Tax=Lewinella sp. W8 TaxID=2528208 RepID=UPI00106853D1|nr:alpha/beta fold hydrolase [Lewinella sp. W8]MTB52910.1 alpha/beta fold hydrolase [Lewinella sp. W8]
MKWLRRLGYVLVGGYVLICILLYAGQERLLFHPRALNADYRYENYQEVWVPTDDATRLHALHLRAAANTDPAARKVVLYLHGNVGNNRRSLHQTRALQQIGVDLLLIDYRGFGKSEGALTTEEHLTEDLQEAYDYLREELDYAEENITVVGYSLGSGPASYLAAENNPGNVVLVAPYTSLTDMKNEFFWMFPDFLMRYPMDNAKRLRESNAPVTILHGTADELIPFRMAEELVSIDPQRINLRPLEGQGHRGAILSRTFGEVVGAIAMGK